MDILKRIFYDPKTGLRSSSLYTQARKIDPTITREMTKEFLEKQGVVQVFKPRKVSVFYPLIATKPGRIQIDLMDMSNEDTVTNKGSKWLFCAVDVFSRYAFCYPQKSKSDSSCIESLRSLIRDAKDVGIIIYQIDSDSESSFQSRQFKSLLHSKDITQNLVPVGDKHRVGIVERFNGTVRKYLNRLKIAFKTTNWISSIPDFLQNYNNTIHRTLNDTPKDAIGGVGSVPYQFEKMDEANGIDYNKTVFSVGDKVRLRIRHSIFDKKSTGVWTKTVHQIEDKRGSDIYVNDRVEPYRKENLQLVLENESPPDVDVERGKEEEARVQDQKVEQRISRRINKEGIDREKDVIVDVNAKVLRRYRKERDLGPMLLS